MAEDTSDNRLRRSARELSLKLRESQIPLRILPVIVWEKDVEPRFHKGQPIRKSVAKSYTGRTMRFSPNEKLRELAELRRKIQRRIGRQADTAKLLLHRVNDYEDVVQLLTRVGQPGFGEASRKLWGSTRDKLFSDGTTVGQYARSLQRLIRALVTPEHEVDLGRVIPAPAVVELMRAHFRQVHLTEHIEVVLSDKIVANAAAGSGRIKIRQDAMFSAKDVQVLIYHEAYTHVATSSNGRSQPYAKWLGFDSPRCTSTQEGLAVLMEIFSNTTYPKRIKKIADRVVAVSMAEEGADPKQVHDYLCQEGYRETEAYQLMSRAFRGTDLSSGQAFTKDVAYLKGLIECFNFVQYCLINNRAKYVPFLFAGKLNVNEMPSIIRAHDEEKVVKRPAWIPGPFQDVDALSSWFICTAALGQMSDKEYHERFRQAF